MSTSNFSIINAIKSIYDKGDNIIRFLNKNNSNTKESILISYDLQAGSYVKNFYEKKTNIKYTKEILNYITQFLPFNSILEAGIGEATTFIDIKNNIHIDQYYGFDISWSRIKIAQNFLKKENHNDVNLFVADLFNIPLKDNSIDIVYTSHAIEPNGGHEREILLELYRITNKFLILFEPDYEYATKEGKKYMNHHGYIKHLYNSALELGLNVILHKPLVNIANPLNPTSVIIISKKPHPHASLIFQCPVTKTELINHGEVYFSKESYLMYPVISKIPYLLPSHAILGCKYGQDTI